MMGLIKASKSATKSEATEDELARSARVKLEQPVSDEMTITQFSAQQSARLGKEGMTASDWTESGAPSLQIGIDETDPIPMGDETDQSIGPSQKVNREVNTSVSSATSESEKHRQHVYKKDFVSNHKSSMRATQQ